MIEKAVIDRFEEDKAVLLVGEKESQVVVHRKSLPVEAKEGYWLKVKLDGEKLIQATIDEEETTKAKQRIDGKLEQLRRGDHLKP